MKFLAILSFLLLLTPVYAVELVSYKIVGQVEDSQITEFLVDIVLLNDGDKALESAKFSVPEGFEIISVSDSYGEIRYKTSTDKRIEIEFFLTRPVELGEYRIIIIKIKPGVLITSKGGYSEYLLVFTPKFDISDFEHVLKLPPDAELYSPKESFPLVVPEASLTFPDGIPTLTWKKELKANQPEVFLARFRAGFPSFWPRVFGALLGIAGLSFLGFIGYKLRIRYKKMKALDALKILNEREKKVMEAIIKNEGLQQYKLRDDLEYSKASLSKILTKLESRGLIKKKKV